MPSRWQIFQDKIGDWHVERLNQDETVDSVTFNGPNAAKLARLFMTTREAEE